MALFAVPASSSPVERVFSVSGIVVDELRSRTSPDLLNGKLLVSLNGDLFPESANYDDS